MKKKCKTLFGKSATEAEDKCYKKEYRRDTRIFNCGKFYNEKKSRVTPTYCRKG